jgi:hypothetical protein
VSRLRTSKKKGLAVSPPKFDKVEPQRTAGITIAAQRTRLLTLDLLMDYEIDGVQLRAGKAKILVDGLAGQQAWGRKVYSTDGVDQFALCPEGEVVGYTVEGE